MLPEFLPRESGLTSPRPARRSSLRASLSAPEPRDGGHPHSGRHRGARMRHRCRPHVRTPGAAVRRRTAGRCLKRTRRKPDPAAAQWTESPRSPPFLHRPPPAFHLPIASSAPSQRNRRSCLPRVGASALLVFLGAIRDGLGRKSARDPCEQWRSHGQPRAGEVRPPHRAARESADSPSRTADTISSIPSDGAAALRARRRKVDAHS